MKRPTAWILAATLAGSLAASGAAARQSGSPAVFLKDHQKILSDLKQSEKLKSAQLTASDSPEEAAGALQRKSNEEKLNQLLRAVMKTSEAIYGPKATVPKLQGFDGNGKPIYGVVGGDDRKNLDDGQLKAVHLKAASATLALIPRHRFVRRGEETVFDLPSANNIGHSGRGLCTPAQTRTLGLPPERFHDEPTPADCSGFKIGPRLVATAAHCVRDEAHCASLSFLAGFYKTTTNQTPHLGIRDSNIYQCTRIVARTLSATDGADWAVVEADRIIDAPTVLLRSRTDRLPPTGEGVTVIGYPMGLPAKVADRGSIRTFRGAYFVANLDTYGGNSGSAVFNSGELLSGRLLVEGILVRGEDDFERTEPCFASKYCPVTGCRGEDVIYAHLLGEAMRRVADSGGSGRPLAGLQAADAP